MADAHPTTQDLLKFIESSPTPFHCAQQAAIRLRDAGFTELSERDAWKLDETAGYFVVRGGAAVAFRTGRVAAAEGGFRIVGAHTDSPNLRIKPLADVTSKNYAQLGVEVYGGALTYTWLDRDLGLAGRVVVRREGHREGHREGQGDLVEQRLVHVGRPVLRVPSLAIHLNRDVRKDGLQLNDQKHLVPVVALRQPNGSASSDAKNDGPGLLRELLGAELGVDPERVLTWDLSLMDIAPPTLGGLDNEMIFAPRLDNQAMCHAAIVALLRAGEANPVSATQIACLYDHEEVGSGSTSGAAGSLCEDVLRRVAEVSGPSARHGDLARATAHSFQISADMAHAVHPNYVDVHEPEHMPRLNGGPVIKFNSQQRYATCAEGAGLFEALCREADVPCQKVVNRTDLPCGGTIGPISAARLGVRTVDVGNPMLSMHSIREQAGAHDPELMVAAMTRFFRC